MSPKIVITLFIGLFHQTGVLGIITGCKDGWVAFNGSCYLFGQSVMSFTTAEQYCRQHGGHLVHVNDAIENTFLKERLMLWKSYASHWWVGISDETVEGMWKWFDTDAVAEFTDFHPGDGGNHHNEDCAMFTAIYSFQWADVGCNDATHIHPLCEMPSTPCDDILVG